MNFKQLAGEKATEFVENNMTVGLGTGSTVYWTIRKLGELLVKEKLKIRVVPTSRQTEKLAREFNIPLATFADVRKIDLTIDGADEISPALDLIKGGGGSLLREKLVAAASKRLIIVADESKIVTALGARALPIEIVPFAWEITARRVEKLNLNPVLRTRRGTAFITDNGNYILDCACRDDKKIDDPAALNRDLKLLPGIIETGFFIGMADKVIIAGGGGIQIKNKL